MPLRSRKKTAEAIVAVGVGLEAEGWGGLAVEEYSETSHLLSDRKRALRALGWTACMVRGQASLRISTHDPDRA